MVASLAVRRVALVGSLLLVRQRAAAQRLAASTTIGVSLRVQAVASFDGGPDHVLSMMLERGVPQRIEAVDGVRTRLTYNAPTRVVVVGTVLRGPDGLTISPDFLCARGSPGATVVDRAFDCAGGFVAALSPEQRVTMPLAVGAAIGADAARLVPTGTYIGQITFLASTPSY